MNTAKRSFANGELAPAMYGRTDSSMYSGGLRTLENAYVMRTGGVQSRPGTAYKGTTKGNAFARLVPCVFDEDQNYLLEFGDESVRFWRDGSPIVVSGVVAWLTATVYAAGVVRSNGGSNYVCTVAHTSGGGTEPGVGGSWATVWYLLTGTIYELPTPYTTQTEVREMQHAAEVGVLRLAHRSYTRRKLTRVSETQWAFEELTSAPTLDFPANLTSDATPGSVVSWAVTAYDSVNGIESLASSPVSGDTEPASPSDTFTQSWDAVSGATSYRIYKSLNGSVYGFVVELTATSWLDTGSLAIDYTTNPPSQVADLSPSGDRPGVLGSYQQRILLSGSINAPDTVRASKTGSPDDFTVSSPLVDADAVTWRMVGNRVVRPRHFLELARRLWQFSNIGEEVIEGDDSGILSPAAVNPRRISANGSAVYPSPLPVNDAALYVQARGSAVRDLLPDGSGADLTLLSSHLVDGYTIVDWCYQQTPHSLIWAVRNDGVLLSLTYQRESGVFGWARHTTDGTVESVACVPEGTEDAVYLVVLRTINGSPVRYIERFVARTAAIASLACSDASLTATQPFSTVTVTEVGFSIPDTAYIYNVDGAGGSGQFETSDVGRDIGFRFNGVSYTAEILTRTDANTISVGFAADPPFGATENFSKPDWWMNPVGFAHLNGETVSVQLDGIVAASPYNSAYTTVTVTGGVVLINQGYNTAIVGLPFVTNVETLDIDTSSGKSVKDGAFLMKKVGMWVDESLSVHVAQAAPASSTGLSLATGGTMQPVPVVDRDLNVVTTPQSAYLEVAIDGRWSSGGRVYLRNVDPSPLSVLAIIPHGDFPR